MHERMRAHWHVMQSANPRLFDGPLLTLRTLDPQTGALSLQRDTYMPYAVQPDVDTGTISLGVTAVIACRQPSGAMAYLFGHRASRTHMYPNQWELGPSGALSPPDSDALTLAHIHGQLAAEIVEEIGVTVSLSPANTTPVCLALDPIARSMDIVMLIALGHRPTLKANWEYQAVEWVTSRDFPAWAASHSVIPPTHAIMRWLADRRS